MNNMSTAETVDDLSANSTAAHVASKTSAMGNRNNYEPLKSFEIEENQQRRRPPLNRKALLTFLAIVVIAAAVVCLTLVFVVYNDSKKNDGDKKERRDENLYQFDDMFSAKFYPQTPDEKWISGNTVLREKDGNIYEYNIESNVTNLLFSGKTLEDLEIDYQSSKYNTLSADGTWMLFAVDSRRNYRYSTVAFYFAVNKNTKKAVKIGTQGPGSLALIQYISWAKKSNGLVFVSNNDVYWIETMENPNAIQITRTGRDKIFFNGIPDWVYEEEILGKRPAVVVSPEDNYLCFASFNDTDVPLFEIALYGKPPTAYTRIQDIAYPKPGTPNPDVRIYIYDIKNRRTKELPPPADIKKSDYYFTNLVWASGQVVSITWMNRAQTTSIVMLCQSDSGVCEKSYELVVDNGWINQNYPDPFFSADGEFYIQILPKNEGEDKGDFLHVAKVNSSKNGKNDVIFLTGGLWEVKKIVALDKKNNVIYYESTETTHTQNHLYSVDLDGKKKCISCELSETKDGRCKSYRSSFSPDSSWYILTCQGSSSFGVPMSWFRSTRNGRVILLESNKDLEKTVKMTSLPTYKYYMIQTSDKEYEIPVREMRPPNFDEKKKYAVLFNVYGGPGSQQISEGYQTGYHTYLSSNYDIIVCEVDGRGTASRGRKFEYAVYKQLGEYERDDTIAAARFMQTKKYVDPKRIAVWGWSYGGFLSSYILSTQKDRVFQSALAVAPVTDWRYYDSIYTERYMGMPNKEDNLIGYEYTSVLRNASRIPDNSFLLVHGTGDDNVHFQNSAQMIEVMTQAGVKFEMQIYTDKHHGLEGTNIHKHLYHLLTSFFKDKLRL